jgi:hypothetical protein
VQNSRAAPKFCTTWFLYLGGQMFYPLLSSVFNSMVFVAVNNKQGIIDVGASGCD